MTATPPNDDRHTALTQAREDLVNYRDKVRDRAIKGFRENFFTLDALNETLLDLGLDQFEPKYVSDLRITLDLHLRTDADCHEADRRLRRLNTPETREAINAAIGNVLAQHGGEDFHIVTGVGSLYADYATRVIED